MAISSPSVAQAVDDWKSPKARRALVAYFTRMASRCTPFGISAGASTIPIAPSFNGLDVRLAAQHEYRRHARLDMGCLDAVVRRVAETPEVRERLCYRPNGTIHRIAGRVHYIESRITDQVRSYHLVAVDDSRELQTLLACAAEGATLQELRSALAELTDARVESADVDSFVSEVVDAQLLLPELEPPVTGPEAGNVLARELNALGAFAEARTLAGAVGALRELDEQPIGLHPSAYWTVIDQLAPLLPAGAEAARVLQVDLVKPAHGRARLGPGR